MTKNIGKPCAGKPHARFDEGRLVSGTSSLLYLWLPVVMRVNNKTRVYTVMTPRAKKAEIRMARGAGNIGAPINGNLWRIGNPTRGPIKAGDIVLKGEDIANLEAMKMENAILAPMDGQISEVCVKLNETVQEGQLLFVIDKAPAGQEANRAAGSIVM